MKMKKYFSLLLATLATLAICVFMGCNNDSELDIDPDAVKITIDEADVSYAYENTNGNLIDIIFYTTPTDFTGDTIHTLLIDLGENPVESVCLDDSFLIEDDSLFDLNIPFSETISLRDGHFTVSYRFLVNDVIKTADYMKFHFTVNWAPWRETQYGFSIRYIEE